MQSVYISQSLKFINLVFRITKTEFQVVENLLKNYYCYKNKLISDIEN